MGEWRGFPAWGWQQQQQQRGPATGRNGRPPHPPGFWNSPIPSWEKRFCTSVCRVPWKKLCETKEVMGIYKNVVQWDDSAALEAFQNAKARFWAEINGLPCDIPLPNPDTFIDKIDYNSVVDPELVADLDRHPPPPVDNNDASNAWDSFDKPIKPTGWGDGEDTTAEHRSGNWDAYIEKPIIPTGWGDGEDPAPKDDPTVDLHSSTWDNKGDSLNAWNSGTWETNGGSRSAMRCHAGWGDGILQVDSRVSGRDDSWNSAWGNSWNNGWNNGRDNSWSQRDHRNSDPDRRYGRKRDGGGRSGSRYTKPRYHFDDHQTNTTWRNRERNGIHYPYEQVV